MKNQKMYRTGFTWSMEYTYMDTKITTTKRTVTHKRRAFTLIELMLTLSIMAIVFVCIAPILSVARLSWDTARSDTEILQNGRILVDHLFRHLMTARCVTKVSDPCQSLGFIECMDDCGSLVGYAVGPDAWVDFNDAGHLSDLAGPVRELTFTCFDGNDLTDHPITDPNRIRLIKVHVTFTDMYDRNTHQSFSTAIYLRCAGP